MKWIFILATVAFGLWVSMYFCLFSGIVATVNAAHAGWPATTTATGIVRIVLAGFTFWITFTVAGFILVEMD